ncbi:MAG: glycosyltransferase family 39 protein [Planctomycetes bacterium]|nr:glycosyltransferase family 39 protein [Planctomycetota bacterium]
MRGLDGTSSGRAAPPPGSAPAALARAALAVLVLQVALRAAGAALFPITYKEAYAWEWSRYPSLGYLDHPPLVAWAIRASTEVLGERSLLAVRLPSLIAGLASLLLVRRLALQLFGDRALALRAVHIASALPVMAGIGLAALPDGLLVFFHLLSASLLAGAIRGEGKAGGHGRGIGAGRVAWCLAGAALGLALLSKLTALLLLPAFAAWLAGSQEGRRWLRRPEPYLALAAAAAVASPFLAWNAAHGWATFRFQVVERLGRDFSFSPLKEAELLLEQLAETSVLAAPLLIGPWLRAESLPEAWRDGWRVLRIQILAVLGPFAAAGAFTETHPHWTAPAYPFAAIAAAALWTARPRPGLTGRPGGRLARGLARGLGWWTAAAQALLLGSGCAALAALPLLARIEGGQGDGSIRRGLAKGRARLLGWDDLHRELEQYLEKELPAGGGLLFADGHREASQLSFRHRETAIDVSGYLKRRGAPGGAQEHYIPAASIEGRSGIFATDSRWIDRDALLRAFEGAFELEPLEQRYGDLVVARYRVFRVERLHR